MIIKTLDQNNPRVTYTADHDKLSPPQAVDAWRSCTITVFQFSEWQVRHNYYFNDKGEKI